MAVVEPHLPDRVLRQFGLLQVIPSDPIAPSRKQSAVWQDSRKRKSYDVDYTWTEGFWDSPDFHLVAQNRRIRPRSPYQASSEYVEWFERVSHPRVDVGRAPVKRLREEQICGMLHMAKKALQQGPNHWRPALENIVDLLGCPSEREIEHGQSNDESAEV